MGLNKDQLIFDPNAASFDDCDTIGSYLIGAGGNVATTTTVGSDEALDVNIVSPLVLDVDLDGIYNATTNADPDNVGAIFHVRNASPDDTHQSFRSTGGQPNSDTVDPALVHGQDVNSFLMGYDAAAGQWERLQTNESGSLLVEIDGQPIEVSESGCDSMENSAKSVTSTATQLVTTALTDRSKMVIQNLGAQAIYVGKNNTVTTANGIKIPKGGSAEFCFSDGLDPYAITDTGTADVRILELA